MNYTNILQEIYQEIQPYSKTGASASYIPELQRVNPDRYGICLTTIDGKEYAMGMKALELLTTKTAISIF